MKPRDIANDMDVWDIYRSSMPVSAEKSKIDDNILAAYIDGKASDAECELVEKAMNTDRELFNTVMDLREIMSAGAVENQESEQHLHTETRIHIHEFSRPRPFRLWQKIAVAAAVAAFMLLGWDLGTTDGMIYTGNNQEAISQTVLADPSLVMVSFDN